MRIILIMHMNDSKATAVKGFEKSIPNHQIDPETGFVHSPAYARDFSPQRKLDFLKVYAEQGMRFNRSCELLGLSMHTVNHALRIDPRFKEEFLLVEKRYTENLEKVSMDTAMTPRGVIDRMCQLKRLAPEKYAFEKNFEKQSVTINIDGNLILESKKKMEVLEAKIVKSCAISTQADDKI